MGDVLDARYSALTPFHDEDDYIEIPHSNAIETKFYRVDRREEALIKYTHSAVAAGATDGEATVIDDLELREVDPPLARMFQLRLGTDQPALGYIEIESGSSPRRGTFKKESANSSNRYVGWFNSGKSPINEPRVEVRLLDPMSIGLKYHNPTGSSITPEVEFTGMRYELVELTALTQRNFSAYVTETTFVRVQEIIKLLKDNRLRHTRRTLYGLKKESKGR